MTPRRWGGRSHSAGRPPTRVPVEPRETPGAAGAGDGRGKDDGRRVNEPLPLALRRILREPDGVQSREDPFRRQTEYLTGRGPNRLRTIRGRMADASFRS